MNTVHDKTDNTVHDKTDNHEYFHYKTDNHEFCPCRQNSFTIEQKLCQNPTSALTAVPPL